LTCSSLWQLQMWPSWLMIYYFEVFARSLIVADGPNWLMIFSFEVFARQPESYLKHGPSNQKDCRCFARWALSMFQE
jgi:hypothetical protein